MIEPSFPLTLVGPFLNLLLTPPRDRLDLASFLISFLNVSVAARLCVIGRPKSTYTRFVEDVLWRKLHGYMIFLKGGE